MLIFYNLYMIAVYSSDSDSSSRESARIERTVVTTKNSVTIDQGDDETAEVKGSSQPLILLWNNYQETGSRVYKTIFHRITSGECAATCRITMDKTRQNESSAIVFHMPDLHWEGYNFPRYRDPGQPWVLMTYESGNSIRQRSFYKGRYPVFDGKQLAGVINRTMTVREDSDIVIR